MWEMILFVSAVFALGGLGLLWRSKAPLPKRIKWLCIILLIPIVGPVLCAVMHDGACRDSPGDEQ